MRRIFRRKSTGEREKAKPTVIGATPADSPLWLEGGTHTVRGRSRTGSMLRAPFKSSKRCSSWNI